MNMDNVLARLLKWIPDDEEVSVHQLTCRTGLDHRTITKYLDLIIQIQGMPKVMKNVVGLRVVVKKERSDKSKSISF